MDVWQPDFQILLNRLILEHRFCSFSTYRTRGKPFYKRFLKAPTLIGIHRAVLEYSFENFTILGKKKNGKVQNRTLPSSIEMSYKVKILRQTGVAPAHRRHIDIVNIS